MPAAGYAAVLIGKRRRVRAWCWLVWSGFWNFIGVVTSSGVVAFGIISLRPVELILQVGSSAGFSTVFAR